MPQQQVPPLTVLLTCGFDDGGRRAAIALGIALAALSNGAEVKAFLSLESVVLGTPQGGEGICPRGFSDPLSTYVEHFIDLGGTLEVCASCYEEYCRHLTQSTEDDSPLREGVEVKGLSVIAERVVHERVLTF